MFCGIDWASERHAVCVLDDAGTKHANFQVGHTADGLDQLIARLGRLGDPAGPAARRTRRRCARS